MLRPLLLLLGVLCVLGTGAAHAQPRVGAALLPVSFLGLPPLQANFLLNSLQDRLSREFALVSQTDVETAYEQAMTSLPGEQCTEENCVALVQEYLKVNLVFNLQVLLDENSRIAQITLSLVEGKRKTVRSGNCVRCGLEELLDTLNTVTTELLTERGRDRVIAEAQPSIRLEPSSTQVREGSAGSPVQVGVGSPLRGTVLLQLSSESERIQFEPPQVSFGPNDWGELKTVNLSVLDDGKISPTETLSVRVSVARASEDLSYGFLGAAELTVTVTDDGQVGLLSLRSSPNGAQVFLNGKPYLSQEGAPTLTPATLELAAGENRIELKRKGYRNEVLNLRVKETRLGSRNVVLRPEGATLRVVVDSENRNGVVVVNNTIRIPLEGETEKELEAEAGEYQVRLEDDGEVSAPQTVVLRGEETQTVQFARMRKAAPSAPEPAGGWMIGLSANLLLEQGTEFPWEHVRLSNHLSGTLEVPTQWGNLEGLYSLTANEEIETPFEFSKGEESYRVTEVSWQKWGVRYWNELDVLPELRFMLGLTEHQWTFDTTGDVIMGSQTYWELGTGYQVNLASRWVVEPRLVFYGSNLELNTAISYEF